MTVSLYFFSECLSSGNLYMSSSWQIHDLQSELDKEKEDAQKKIHKFEEALK